MNHLLQLRSLSINEIMNILLEALRYKRGEIPESETGKIVSHLFFEPSTRTQYSFNTAAYRLGCQVINFNVSSSSINKGETFYDTIKTFASFQSDALVIRSSLDEYYKDLVGKITVPIINAGDGVCDHPTQSLLDLMTIYETFGHFSALKVAIVGDILHSRVANTNIEVMERFGMTIYTSGPPEFMVADYRFLPFSEALATMDIIYLLRIQHERHQEAMLRSLENYHQEYGLDAKRAAMMKEGAIIMHPAPFNRNVEIADDVVECEKSKIFTQIENGVFVRMAVLKRAWRDKRR